MILNLVPKMRKRNNSKFPVVAYLIAYILYIDTHTYDKIHVLLVFIL